MRRRVVAIQALAFLMAAAGSAGAADAVGTPVAPTPEQGGKHFYVWSGPYAGAFADYNWNDVDALSGKTADGIGGGIYGGYNWQFDNYVLGVESDLGFSGANATVAGLKADQGLFGSVRGRVGYVFNPFMLYATGGVAASQNKLENALSSDTRTNVGWTAGVGAEAAITDKVNARIEYRYSDYGSKSYKLTPGPVSSGFDEQSVRAGIGIKF